MFFLLLFFVIIVVISIRCYNQLKVRAKAVRSRRSNILAVTCKRADLASRLVDIVNGHGSHEKLAHLQISEDITSIAALKSINAGTDRAIQQVAALAMAFPNLKANQTFQQLMLQLEKIETEILQRRETYNQAVEQYNAYRVRLPQAPLAVSATSRKHPTSTPTRPIWTYSQKFNTGDTKAVEAIVRRASERARTLAVTAHSQWQAGQQKQRGSKVAFPIRPAEPAQSVASDSELNR